MGKFKMHKIHKAIYDFLIREQIWDMPVTVALSGGADSVCLLMGLLYWREEFHLELSALHVQHDLRGAESLRDEQFCRDLCEKYEIELQVILVDVKTYQKIHGISLETAARECRYQAFSDHGIGLVATAHTASDNLETLIFRLVRGTGLKGLCGIPPRRENYIRPLLEISRSEIELFLAEENIDYIIDSSNLQDDYTRNFIRHKIRPLLGQINQNPEKSGIMLTDLLRQEEDFLEISTRNAYKNALQPDHSLKDLHLLHPALQRRCIGIYLQTHKISANYQNIILVQGLLAGGGCVELVRGQLTARVSQGRLYLERNQNISYSEAVLRIGRNQIFKNWIFTAELISRKDHPDDFDRVLKNSVDLALDYDRIQDLGLILHSRKPGLHLKLSNREHRIFIKKWLQTLPVSQRASVHYLSDKNQHLRWVQHLGADESVRVTEHTRNILFLHVHSPDTECT